MIALKLGHIQYKIVEYDQLLPIMNHVLKLSMRQSVCRIFANKWNLARLSYLINDFQYDKKSKASEQYEFHIFERLRIHSALSKDDEK